MGVAPFSSVISRCFGRPHPSTMSSFSTMKITGLVLLALLPHLASASEGDQVRAKVAQNMHVGTTLKLHYNRTHRIYNDVKDWKVHRKGPTSMEQKITLEEIRTDAEPPLVV